MSQLQEKQGPRKLKKKLGVPSQTQDTQAHTGSCFRDLSLELVFLQEQDMMLKVNTQIQNKRVFW